jgi:hypothetical protein
MSRAVPPPEPSRPAVSPVASGVRAGPPGWAPAASRPASGGAASRPQDLVALIRRLIAVQAGLTIVLSLAFPGGAAWLALALAISAGLAVLSGRLRSGTHAAWLTAVAAEAICLAAGLARLVSARYLGGTLLAIVTLGALLHPAVSRAFSARPDGGRPADGRLAVLPASRAGGAPGGE